MSFLSASLKVVLFFALGTARGMCIASITSTSTDNLLTRLEANAQVEETVISDGAPVATTTAAGGANVAGEGVVIPFAPASGGLVQASTVYASPSSSVPGAGPSITPAPPMVAGSSPSSPTVNPNPDCQQCSLYFEYVNAYYWPTENTNNTACLAGVTDQPQTTLPPGLTP